MIAIDVRTGGFFQVVFFDVREDLLPASEILNQAVESFKHTERHKGVDEPLFCAAVPAQSQDQKESGQIGGQQQEVRQRLIGRQADSEMRRAKHLTARSPEYGRQGNGKWANLKQNQG